MKRIFLGIPLSEEIKGKCLELQQELSQFEGINLVSSDNFHFTLKFLGDVEENKIEEIKELLKTIDFGNKFSINIKKIGVFPNSQYVKVIWLGVEEDQQAKSLFQKVEEKLGKQFPQDFEFTTHLTLARVKFVKDKERLLEFLQQNKEVEVGETEVNKVILYESVLTPEGPKYSILEEFLLT